MAQTPPAFAELYAAHYPRLAAELGLVCGDRSDGADVAQEAFVRLLERWSRLASYDDPTAWVRHVGYNLARDRVRRRASESRKATRWLQLVGRGQSAPRTDAYAVADPHDPLTVALRLLPAEQREVVVLQAVLDLTNQRVADLLDLPIGTVKSRLSRARAALARQLEGAPHD